MTDIPEGAIAMAVRLSGEPREMVLAGFKLGVDYAANVIKVCTDEQTDKTMSPQLTPPRLMKASAQYPIPGRVRLLADRWFDWTKDPNGANARPSPAGTRIVVSIRHNTWS